MKKKNINRQGSASANGEHVIIIGFLFRILAKTVFKKKSLARKKGADDTLHVDSLQGRTA